ncbi:la-related protein 1C-like [Impatiens glandulifera]|uniref:la-related protein 1C-like n=1 Tax=Impatiens glandulifera TaxID=253017 RepID=UPI001FB0C1DF|nr:la-related protein 1C-like [Impatiens glandulifera]
MDAAIVFVVPRSEESQLFHGPPETHRGGASNAVSNPPRAVWDKPSSNGGVIHEVGHEVGPVLMDSQSWPSLLESTKISSKSVSSNVLDDGSHTTMQVSSSHTVTTANKDGGFVAPSSQFLQTMPSNSAEPPQPVAVVERGPTEPQPTAVVERARRGGRGRGPQSYGGQPHNHPHHHQSFHNNNNGVRRDHNRGGRSNGNGNWHNYHANRSFNNRDATANFQARGFVPMEHYPNHPFIQQNLPFYGYRPYMRFMYPPPPPILPIPMPQQHNSPPPPPLLSEEEFAKLNTRIVRQINYYFSDSNIETDIFLRKQMDRDGWVPIKTIAEFKMIKEMTHVINNDIAVVLNAMKSSEFMEVLGNKIRRREDFQKWPIIE